MDLPAAAALAGRLEWVDSSASTNAQLAALAAGDPDLPDPTVLVTDVQTAGRGRRGRGWWAPPGTSLAVSVLLRPRVPPAALPWVPLAAGAAMAASLRALGVDAALKWPNDVLVRDRKVCGVLAEVLPDGERVVVGAGLNHRIPPGAMPVETATSLLAEGGPVDPDVLVAGWLRELGGLRAVLESTGEAERSGLRGAVEARLATLGRRVRVELPGAPLLTGRATGLDADGALVVDAESGAPRRIAAGDVTHLRYE